VLWRFACENDVLQFRQLPGIGRFVQRRAVDQFLLRSHPLDRKRLARRLAALLAGGLRQQLVDDHQRWALMGFS
jgi:hypothetical protein